MAFRARSCYSAIMGRKFFISVSLLFSATVIIFGGYNCARQSEVPFGGGPGSGNTHSGPPPPTDGGDPLPPEPEDDRCNRSYWRKKAKDFGGAGAYIRTNRSNFQDFNLGRPQNFSINCTRMLLNMTRMRGNNVFKGNLAIVYEDGDTPAGNRYSSGSSIKENQNNHWSGSWRGDRNNRTSAKFNAIFEHEKGDMAVILQIDEVDEVDIGDGEVGLRGAGSIWFKMFRSAIGYINDRSDVCLRSSGYLRFAQSKPPRPRWKCWFVPIGPYNCRPEGIDTTFNTRSRQHYSEKAINISGNLPCYDEFGTFENLDINKAFNVRSGDDHP